MPRRALALLFEWAFVHRAELLEDWKLCEKNQSPKKIPPVEWGALLWRLTKVTPLANYKLEVEFVDGICGTVEMFHRIMSDNAGAFAKLQDIKLFNQVYLQYGAATWPGEIDLAPDAMHDEIMHHGRWVLS